jgi:glycine cleavage system H lipoate-binding protein
MQSIIEFFQAAGVFLLFLAARFALLLVVLAALAVVFMAGLGVVRSVQRIRRRSLGVKRVGGLLWRNGVYYSPGHAWLQWKGERTVRVGLDDLAQHLFSKITEVVLPEAGQTIQAGQPVAAVKAGRRRALIPSPVEGKVVAINRRLLRNPSLLHTDPYASGWLYAVEPAEAGYTRLPYGEPSRKWFDAEARRFSTYIEHELGVAAADGGELVAPGPTLLSDAQWQTMTAHFLQAPEVSQAGA